MGPPLGCRSARRVLTNLGGCSDPRWNPKVRLIHTLKDRFPLLTLHPIRQIGFWVLRFLGVIDRLLNQISDPVALGRDDPFRL